jgi:hypothetical protein
MSTIFKIIKIFLIALVLITITLLYALGVRWPSHHHVKKPNIPSSIYIKANDFKTTTGYHISVLFEACCSDALICKDIMRSKGIDQIIEFQLDANNRSASIPLDWIDRSFCPYRISSIFIENNAHSTLLSISDDASSEPLPDHYILQSSHASNGDYKILRFVTPPTFSLIEIQ